MFDDQYQTVTIPGYLKDNRDANFEEAANVLLDNWRKNNELVPNSISAAISMKGEGINSIDAEALVGIIKKSDWVLHENIDLQTVCLVPREIHSRVRHMGGFSLAKHLKEMIARKYYQRFITSVSSGVVQAAA